MGAPEIGPGPDPAGAVGSTGEAAGAAAPDPEAGLAHGESAEPDAPAAPAARLEDDRGAHVPEGPTTGAATPGHPGTAGSGPGWAAAGLG